MNRANRREVPLPADGFILPWLFNGASVLPMRSFSDFLLNFAQYQIPLINGLGSWKDQIFNNLLYYQTNYFSILVALLLLAGFLYHPEVIEIPSQISRTYAKLTLFVMTTLRFSDYKEVIQGVVRLLFVWFIIFMRKPICNTLIRRNNLFKRVLKSTLVSYILSFALFCFVGKNDDSCALVMGSVLLPCIFAFVHAALRRQNIENQLFKELGATRLSYTLMGILLERLRIIRFQVYRPRYQRQQTF